MNLLYVWAYVYARAVPVRCLNMTNGKVEMHLVDKDGQVLMLGTRRS